MKKIGTRTALFLFAISLMAFTTIQDWVTFTSKEGKYSILMPNQPETKDEKGGEAGTASAFSTSLAMSKHNRTVFIAGYVDYSPLNNFDINDELTANKDNFVSAVGGKLIESKNVKFAGHDGIYFTALAESTNYLYTSYVFLVGRRPYQLVIGSPEGKPSADEKKFFDSFKLTK